MSERAMTKKEVLKRIKGLDDDTAKSVVCALVGHSKVVQICFGQVTCARCDTVIGDKLMGRFNDEKCVIVGHACDTCRENAETLTWRDKLLVDVDQALKEYGSTEGAAANG